MIVSIQTYMHSSHSNVCHSLKLLLSAILWSFLRLYSVVKIVPTGYTPENRLYTTLIIFLYKIGFILIVMNYFKKGTYILESTLFESLFVGWTNACNLVYFLLSHRFTDKVGMFFRSCWHFLGYRKSVLFSLSFWVIWNDSDDMTKISYGKWLDVATCGAKDKSCMAMTIYGAI